MNQVEALRHLIKMARDLLRQARELVVDLRLLLSRLRTQEGGYIDLAAAATYMDLSVGTVRRIIPDHLKFRVSNRKVLIRKSELDEWLERFRQPPEEGLREIVDEVVSKVLSKENLSGTWRID